MSDGHLDGDGPWGTVIRQLLIQHGERLVCLLFHEPKGLLLLLASGAAHSIWSIVTLSRSIGALRSARDARIADVVNLGANVAIKKRKKQKGARKGSREGERNGVREGERKGERKRDRVHLLSSASGIANAAIARSGEGEAGGGAAERVGKGATAGGGVSTGSARAEGARVEAWKGDLKGVRRDGARWRLDRVAKGLEILEKEVVRRREAAGLTHAPAHVDSSGCVDSVDSVDLWRLPAVRKRWQKRWWGGHTVTSGSEPSFKSHSLQGKELVAVRGVVQPAYSGGGGGGGDGGGGGVAASNGGGAFGAGAGGGIGGSATTAGGAAVLGGVAAREGVEWQGVVEYGRSVHGDGVTAGAVIVERVDEMVYSELHALLGWRVKSERVNSFRSEVPFCLAESPDTSAPRVSISLATNPSDQHPPIPLVTLHSHLHKALPPTLASTAHLIAGRRMPLGMRSEHRVLPVNHALTAVGHVHVSKDGRAALVPSSHLPFFLLNESREAALQRLQQQRRNHVQRGALFALAAAAVAGFMWWRKRRNERREREYEQQRAGTRNEAPTWQGAAAPWPEEFPALLPATAHDPSSRLDQQLEEILEAVEEIREAQREERGEGGGEGQEEEEEEEEGLDLDAEHELPAEQVCVVCAGRVRRAVFIPCGHRVCCLRCARAVKESSSICPICRRFVRRVYQVFDT
ncbi:unnamed protein product [Closterium sp. NIES-64]|nr:unnamed protein product [Closterium sp. NIES-64]CAI6007996.1 unnamed protein product [Closterium sp. NIES-65]